MHGTRLAAFVNRAGLQLLFNLHPFSTVEDLYIEQRYSKLVWKNDAIEDNLWLQLLLPFTAVKNLYLPKEFAPGIAAALEELIDGRIAEVLPSLQNISVEGLKPSGPFPGKYWAVHDCATALRSPCHHFCQ